MKTPTLLLHARENGLEAWQLQAQGLSHQASFETGDHQAFAAWLGTRPPAPRLRLLLDFADEGFETEALPRVRGRDRRALIERRLASHFDASPVSWSRSLGQDPAAPHLERLQFYGLTRPALLSPWLQACHGAGAALEAVCPAALLLEHLAPHALALREDCLLVSFGRSGMRLSHFRDARLRFSRLVPGLQASASDPRWRDEIRRTRSYLNAQRDGARNAALPAIVLATGLDSATADDALQFHDPAKLGGNARVGTEAEAVDAALLHALQHAPHTLHCHWPGRREGLPGLHLPRAPGGAGLVPLLAGLGVIVLNMASLGVAAVRWADASALEHEATALEARSSALQRERTQIETARPPLPAPPPALLALITRLEHEEAGAVDTPAVFRTVSAALDPSPGLALLRLSWQHQGELQASETATPPRAPALAAAPAQDPARRSDTRAETGSATNSVTNSATPSADARTRVTLSLALVDDPALPPPTTRIDRLIEQLQAQGVQALQHALLRSAAGERLELRFELSRGERP